MAEDYYLQTDAEGVRDFRRLRQTAHVQPGSDVSPLRDDPEETAIVVELLTHLPDDNFDQHDAQRVRWTGSEWETIGLVKVRKVTAPGIEATQPDGYAVRVFARVVGNLGYCIDTAAATNAGINVQTTTQHCCGKCLDADDLPTVSDGGTDFAVGLRVALPVLTCCAYNSQQITKMRYDQSSNSYKGVSDPTACLVPFESTTISWELVPATGILTGTHSIEGVVAVYESTVAFNSLCPNHLELDESTTPQHDADCSICGDKVCVLPDLYVNLDQCYACQVSASGGEVRGAATVTLVEPVGWSNDCTAAFGDYALYGFDPLPSTLGDHCVWQHDATPPDIDRADCTGSVGSTFLTLTPTKTNGDQVLTLALHYYASTTAPVGAHTALYRKTFTPSLSAGETACIGAHTLTFLSGGDAAHGLMTSVDVFIG